MIYKELQSKLDIATEESKKGNLDNADLLVNEVLAKLDISPQIKSDDREREIIETLRAEAILQLANTNWIRGDYDTALEHAHRGLAIAEENNLPKVKAKGQHLLGNIQQTLGAYGKALEYYNCALDACNKLGDKSFVAKIIGNIGVVYFNLGIYDKALEYYDQAHDTYQEIDGKLGIAFITGNIGIVYSTLGAYDKALEYLNRALNIHREYGNKSGAAAITMSVGNVYHHLGDSDKALEYYNLALNEHKEIGYKLGVARVTGNIGIMYASDGNLDKALEYYNLAHAVFQEIGDKQSVAMSNGNIGAIYANIKYEGYNPTKAEDFLIKAITVSQEIGTKPLLASSHKDLADLYENQKRWEEFAFHLKKHIEIKDEVNLEEVKKQDAIRQQKKEIEIAKASANARLGATTTLLHKVLPQKIASRMIEGEEIIADYFPTASILFADIEGFTPISADMPATIVVQFLNAVFGEFDRIMLKHGCEKIKTIGDGYMAAAGVPVECSDHAERITAAAFEMIDTLAIPVDIIDYLPEDVKLGIRIGLHTGPVVAGVIGQDRFVYDIYSDAVNTAARMESHGFTNRVHVSSEFALHLQNRFMMTKNNAHGITFEKRGEIEVKGKGKMKTYFLEKHMN